MYIYIYIYIYICRYVDVFYLKLGKCILKLYCGLIKFAEYSYVSSFKFS